MNIKHKDIGPELTKAEWEAVDTHVLTDIGDMTKTIYDANGNGIVDKAESIPSGASLPESPKAGDMYVLTTDNHLYVAI